MTSVQLLRKGALGCVLATLAVTATACGGGGTSTVRVAAGQVAAVSTSAGSASTGSASTGSASTGTGSAGTTSTAAAPASRPNIVFVLTDDLATNLVQYMPHVRALQREGTTFSNYSVTDSLCCPSRSSIFSGKFPHDTGIFTNGGSDGGFNTFHSRGEEADTFATALQGAGYRTAMMGKYLNGYLPPATLGGAQPYVPPGWNEWDVAGNGYPEFNYSLNENHQVVHYGSAPADYLTSVVGGRGSAFIRTSAAAKTPFLLEIASFTPHAPYTPAPRDAKSFPGLKAPRTAAFNKLPTAAPRWLAGRAKLTAAEKTRINTAFRKRVQDVQSLDRMIANLQTTLNQAGVADSTMIVFSSDNGYHMGEHRLDPGKMTAFDTDVRVPLVVAGPGVPANRVVAKVVENIDLAPTFETLGGVTPAAEVDGHSLVPLLHAQSAAGWRTAALIEHHGPDTDKTDPDLPAKNSGNPPSYEALRTASATYVEYADGTKEYYNRTTDPSELHNVVAKLTASTRKALHAELTRIKTCHGSTACWTAARR